VVISEPLLTQAEWIIRECLGSGLLQTFCDALAHVFSRAPGPHSKKVPTCILAGLHTTSTRLGTDAAVLVFLGMPLRFLATPSARLRTHVYHTPNDLSVRSSKSSGDSSCNIADVGAV
jgi:hypothetical protein